MSFDACASQLLQTEDYVFGSAAVPAGAIQKAIRNQADLAQYFNPTQDFTGSTSINEEIQRYQPFNTTNHAFAADRLNLCARLDGSKGYTSGWKTTVSQTSGTVQFNGTSAISALGWTSSTPVQLGQVVIFQYQNTVSLVTAIGGGNVTLLSLNGNNGSTTSALNAVLPVYALGTSITAANGATQLTFPSIPSGVTVGMQVALYLGGIRRNADHIVTAISGNTITVDTGFTEGGALGTNQPVLFLPPITSGQLWTKQRYDLTREDLIWGFDLDVVFATDSGGGTVNTRGVNTASAFQAVPGDYPWGYFPCAGWLYKADDGTPDNGDTSEKDFGEVYLSTTNGYYMTLAGDLGPGAVSPPVFLRTFGNNYGAVQNTDFVATPFSMSGAHRVSGLITPNGAFTFLDGLCIRHSRWRWTGVHPAQYGIDLAAGSIAPNYAANVMVPLSASGIANMTLGIKRFRTYCSGFS